MHGVAWIQGLKMTTFYDLPVAVYSKALVAAEAVKGELRERLAGRKLISPAGELELVDFVVPRLQHFVGHWRSWLCELRDSEGKQSFDVLSRYFDWAELFPIFRRAFAGIEVSVARAVASVHTDFGVSRGFVPSGRRIAVDARIQHVRPIGDSNNSVWVNASLLMMKSDGTSVVACRIDALEFGEAQGFCYRDFSRVAEPSELPTIHIRLWRCAGTFAWVPIARVVDREAGVLELDARVEVFCEPSGEVAARSNARS